MEGTQPDRGRLLKILVGAGIVVIVLIMIILIITNHGIAGILPSSILPVATYTMTTPGVTSYIVIEPPAPEPTTGPAENLSPPSTTPVTPRTSPPLTKAPVCPSDRHACGANCTDIMTDQYNCGGCNITCTSSQICQQGICLARCTSGETSCPDGCRDLLYDEQNCGTCGNSCPVGLACNKSVCAPTLPTTIPTYAG